MPFSAPMFFYGVAVGSMLAALLSDWTSRIFRNSGSVLMGRYVKS